MTKRAVTIEQARDALAGEAWPDAYEALRALDPAELTAADLEGLADAAWWLSHLRESLDVRPGAPKPGLYDLEVPGYILDRVYWPDNHISRVLAPLRTRPTFDQPGLLGVLDDRGNATSAVLDQKSVSAPGPNGDCGWWAPDGDVTVGLLRPVPAGDGRR